MINLYDFYKAVAAVSENSLLINEKFCRYNAPNNSWANLTFNVNINKSDFSILKDEELIMLSPLTDGLTQNIIQDNFSYAGYWEGMVLEAKKNFEMNKIVHFKTEKNLKHFNDWFYLSSSLKERKNSLDQDIFDKIYQLNDFTFIVGYKNKSPVASGLLFIKENIASLYLLTVIPNQRRQGIGTEMVKHLSNIAFSKNANIIALQATQNSISLYQNIGFKKVGKFEYYTKKA